MHVRFFDEEATGIASGDFDAIPTEGVELFLQHDFNERVEKYVVTSVSWSVSKPYKTKFEYSAHVDVMLKRAE